MEELQLGQDRKSPYLTYLTFDLKLWPWPLSYRLGSCTQHTLSSKRTIMPGIIKFYSWMEELQPGQDRKSPYLTFDLKLWPWPLRYRPGSCTRHTLSTRRTIVPGMIKFYSLMEELQPGQDQKSPYLTFDLKLWPWPLRYRLGSCTRHTLSSKRTIVPGMIKFYSLMEELQPGQDQKSPYLTFDLKLWPWPLRYRLGSCTRHTLSSKRTIMPGMIKFYSWI